MALRTQNRQSRRVFRHVIDDYYQGHHGFGHDQEANNKIVQILWRKTKGGRRDFTSVISAEEALWLRVMLNTRFAERRLEEMLRDKGSDKHVSLILGKKKGRKTLTVSFWARPASC